MTADLDDAIFALTKALGGAYENGEHTDAECVTEATRRLNEPQRTWCYVCDRPQHDCGCVEKGGYY